MKKMTIATLCCIATPLTYAQQAPTPATGKPELIEKIEQQPGKRMIAYEKWRLPNGLTLIIHEDHSDPIVDVNVVYHVGSNRETPGRSGFAHFFEHMMFQGSDHVKDEEHFKIIASAGGTNNGFTNNDITAYVQTAPSNQLEVLLWLEADRMGFLLDSVTTKKFENQRKTVKNEKFQNQLDVPYGMVEELKAQNLYTPGHPYSWTVIGYTDDLDSANVDDLKNFFLRWYVPNNAILSVSGDVNPSEVVELTMKYFGTIPRGRDMQRLKIDPVIVAEDKYANSKDDVVLPLTEVIYPGVPAYHRDEPALELLAVMLGNGKNTVLYKNFIKAEKGGAGAFYNGLELAGEFTVFAELFPVLEDGTEQNMNDIETLIRKSIEEFGNTGITDEALKVAKAKVRAGIIGQGEAVSSKAFSLIRWELLGLKYNIQDELDRFDRVTKEDLLRVFNKYIKGRKAIYINVWPLVTQKIWADGPDAVKEIKKNFKKESINPYANLPKKEIEEYKGLVYNKAKDNFDRKIKPTPKTGKQVEVPAFYREKFSNGIEISGIRTSELPVVSLMINIKGGHLFEDGKEFTTGTANLTAEMMNEGTVKDTTEAVSAKLEKLGSVINFFSGRTETTISLWCLAENIDATLKVLEEKLYTPGFREKDFKRIKKQRLEEIPAEKDNAEVTNARVFNKLTYGDNVLGDHADGTWKQVKSIKLEDVKKYYEKCYVPELTMVVVTGDISKEVIMPKLEFLKKWKAKGMKLPEITINQPADKTQIYLVHQTDNKKAKAIVSIGHPSHKYDATGIYYKNQLMNYVLGGNFNSRINLNLREDKGYTYGAFSGFYGGHYGGRFAFNSTIGRSSATDSSIVEVMKEIKNYRDNGITDEELEFMKNFYLFSDALQYETSSDKAGYIEQILDYNLPDDYRKQQMGIVKNITKEEINKLAKENINPDKIIILVVGNKYLVQEQLEKLGYGKVKELDKEGN